MSKRVIKTRSAKLSIKDDKKNNNTTMNKENMATERPVTRLCTKNYSYRVLDDNPISKGTKENVDVYNFTFDPNDEPPPKKKRKKTVRKKVPAKTRSVIVKNNYKDNISKTLVNLRNVMKDKKKEVVISKTLTKAGPVKVSSDPSKNIKQFEKSDILNHDIPLSNNETAVDTMPEPIHGLVYSPHTSARFPKQSNVNETRDQIRMTRQPDTNFELAGESLNTPKAKDPLNLCGDLSFFDEHPIASSSFIGPSRHPTASPWRVEYQELPLKWGVNTYVKPNMTPSFECSFVGRNEPAKKHVYTNLMPETNDDLPHIDISKSENSRWKQTSIFSYIKEVVDKNESKKKNSLTPTKANSLFLDNSDESTSKTPKRTPEKIPTSVEQITPSKDVPVDNFQSTPVLYHNIAKEMASTPINKDMVNSEHANEILDTENFFGFDDSENVDQENTSPKKLAKKRSLRHRKRVVLGEINRNGPLRGKVTKSKIAATSEAVNKIYEQLKENPKALPVVEQEPVCDNSAHGDNDETIEDSPPLALFEDVEVVHHSKPTRKSYGKSKKTTFQQTFVHGEEANVSDSDFIDSDDNNEYDDESFKLPKTLKEKKIIQRKKKNNKLSKKEQAEVEAWVACFNSMCEDVDEFDLVVE